MASYRTFCHRVSVVLSTVVFVMASSSLLFAQSPWERAASNLEIAFTGPIARSLALVAIVIGGLTFMFGEAGAKRALSGIVFGGADEFTMACSDRV